MKDFRNSVCRALAFWEKRLCRQIEKHRGEWWLGGYDDERSAEAQKHFIRYMTACMMLDGSTGTVLRRIRAFLRLQLPESDPAFTISLQGGIYGFPLYVGVDRLGQLDFADAWEEVRFCHIGISSTLWKQWTRKRIDLVKQHIREDFEFDGLYADISADSGFPGLPGTQEICFSCKIIQ